MQIVMSFCGLCLLLVVGKFLRVKLKFIQRLYLPTAVVAGVVGLVLVSSLGDHLHAGWTAGWGKLPGFLINIVFAALFMGVEIPPIREIWNRSGVQLAYGQIVAWGQYLVGIGIVLVVLGPLMGVPHIFGVIVPVGFEGGHGTAGGLAPTFEQLGWAEGSDFGLASATVGIVSAIIIGFALINWAARKGYVTNLRDLSTLPEEEQAGMYPEDKRPSAGKQTTSPDSVESLALHLAIIGVAVLIGYGLKISLVAVEKHIPGMNSLGIFAGFPLFPLCMLGGLLIQVVLPRISKTPLIDRGLMQRLAGTALDFLVVAAVSTIRLEVIARDFVPFIVIVACGLLWNVFCVMWLARRMLPNAWFERAIAEMGQSTGVTATGLLLLRSVDPESRTEAPSAFGYKQLLHEPFMGGGLWTSAAVVVVAKQGGLVVLAISGAAIALWLAVWFLFLRPKRA